MHAMVRKKQINLPSFYWLLHSTVFVACIFVFRWYSYCQKSLQNVYSIAILLPVVKRYKPSENTDLELHV
jgi:hypothetical protein